MMYLIFSISFPYKGGVCFYCFLYAFRCGLSLGVVWWVCQTVSLQQDTADALGMGQTGGGRRAKHDNTKMHFLSMVGSRIEMWRGTQGQTSGSLLFCSVLTGSHFPISVPDMPRIFCSYVRGAATRLVCSPVRRTIWTCSTLLWRYCPYILYRAKVSNKSDGKIRCCTLRDCGSALTAFSQDGSVSSIPISYG